MNIDKIIEDSPFIHEWKRQITESLNRIDKDLDEDEVDEVLNKMIKERIQFPKVTLDNNYTGESRETNLLSTLDWAINRKPIMAGNGTFYKNQHEAINPIAKMLEDFLAERKRLKKLMFSIDDPSSDKYQDLDRGQQNQKILANSYYGASGMKQSAFYSTWSGPATTGSAQAVISSTTAFFESFLVDNYKFIDIDECFAYMNAILDEEYEIDDWVIPASFDETYKRFTSMFYKDTKGKYDNLILKYLSNRTQDELTKLFYKNNLLEFTRRHKILLDYYEDIFNNVQNLEYAKEVSDIPISLSGKYQTVKDYNSYVNKQYFMDPNSPPETIIDTLKAMDKIYTKYVFLRFMSIDKIFRLKYFNRKTVCIVDTDSNILALDLWVDFCKNEILHGNYGRSDENNVFIIINTLTYFITSTVAKTLDFVGINSNIPEDFRPIFAMKNEFYFNKLIIGKKKKRYISSIKLREGNLFDPYKPDVKGFEFRKATTSEEAKKVFDDILERRIFKTDIPDIPGILGDLKEFEDNIRNSILSGDTIYLPLGNAKELEAYKDPFSQQGVRGSLAWNIIYPDNQISFPSKVSLLKLNIFDIDDIAQLESKNTVVYNRIKRDIFGSKIKKFADKGLQVIAIPSNSKIPDWCMDYIDYNTIINNIIGQFKGVLDTFGINCPEVGKSIKSVNRKTKKFSNIVRF